MCYITSGHVAINVDGSVSNIRAIRIDVIITGRQGRVQWFSLITRSGHRVQSTVSTCQQKDYISDTYI